MEDDDGIEHPPPPDLWQILHSPQTQDGPKLQFEHYYNKRGIQHKATTLDFGASDWNAVIQRGYSWTDFESFVYQRECVYVGPFWITEGCEKVDHTKTFMKLGELFLAMNPQQTDHSDDDDVKSLVLPFLKLFSLHPDRKRCWIYSQAKWWLPIILNECEIIFYRLYIYKHDHIDATTLHLTAAMTKFLGFCHCSIVSTTSTPYPPPTNRSRNNRLQELHLDGTEWIDADLFKSFIQECTALEKMSVMWNLRDQVEPHFTSDQWMAFMAVCSACKTLEDIFFNKFKVETTDWLPGLELLMRSQSLSGITYYLHSYESPTQEQIIPDSLKLSRTNAIVQALVCNKNIIKLVVLEAEIDVATYQSTVPPILRCNKLWKNITPFCRDMDDTRGSTQLLGRLLSHRLLHQSPSFLFELVCKVNHQIAHAWHDGRHRRVLITADKRKRDY